MFLSGFFKPQFQKPLFGEWYRRFRHTIMLNSSNVIRIHLKRLVFIYPITNP